MFKFIEKNMELEDRDYLNFKLGIASILCVIFTIYIWVSPFKAFIFVFGGIDIIVFYCLYRNNLIGLREMRAKKKEYFRTHR